MNKFMEEAIFQANLAVSLGHGRPLGAVVVKDGEVIGWGHDMVLKTKDATAFAELVAIRNAGGNIGTPDLSGCELYTTGEPCTMSLCACIWAGITKVYYGASMKDEAIIGLKEQVALKEKLPDGFIEQIESEEVKKLFQSYVNKTY